MSRLFIALLVFAALGADRAAFSQTRLSLGPTYVVLRNGGVLKGQVTRLGDRYQVLLDTNNEVRVAANDVDCLCATLDEAFQKRKANLPPGQVGARLDLVEWCLRHNLIPQAADQLTIAIRLEPDNPRIANLERRLDVAFRVPAQAAPSQASTTTTAVAPASTDDLERAARELPNGTVERFTSTIQPMLLNRCSTNGCHGPNGPNGFHLIRPPAGQSTTRRYTLRNLHATLGQISRSEPDDSRLLTLVREPHGGGNSPVFGRGEQVQYEQLVGWVRQVSQPKQNPAPASIRNRDSRLLQTTGGLVPPDGGEFPLPANAATNSPSAQPEAPTAAASSTPAALPSIPQPNAPPTASSLTPNGEPVRPRDPFDAAGFNQPRNR